MSFSVTVFIFTGSTVSPDSKLSIQPNMIRQFLKGAAILPPFLHRLSICLRNLQKHVWNLQCHNFIALTYWKTFQFPIDFWLFFMFFITAPRDKFQRVLGQILIALFGFGAIFHFQDFQKGNLSTTFSAYNAIVRFPAVDPETSKDHPWGDLRHKMAPGHSQFTLSMICTGFGWILVRFHMAKFDNMILTRNPTTAKPCNHNTHHSTYDPHPGCGWLVTHRWPSLNSRTPQLLNLFIN